jgi:hypothetical protein
VIPNPAALAPGRIYSAAPHHLTTQNYESSDLSTKTPQIEENECVIVIYALKLVTEQNLESFLKTFEKLCFFCLGG